MYRARDTRLGRSVAVKVVKASGTRDPALRERFEREARAISALDHPHICPLYDVGQDAGVEFLVMPCLEGETLASRLHTGALPLDRAVAIATQIADALDRAHRAGFVHRDLKPANIMLTKGSGARHGEVHATLLDFGLAKLTASPVALNPSLAATQPPQENLTGDATLVGTLQYMAPEQIEGKPIDARADLFALGAILHEMITGRPAFAAASPASLIAAILAHDPTPLSATCTSVSLALDATVQRCLAKSPDDRFQSASDLRFALQTLGHEHPHGADVGPHRSRRNLPVRAVLTVAGAITLAGIGWMVTRPLSSVRASVPRLLNSLQVTNAVGVEDYAAWSPDGRTLAYAADPSGGLFESNWDIWVVQPGGTQSLNRTPDSSADDRFPSWSPDGTLLAFWSNRDGGGCYVMPALAGSPRRIAEASPRDPNPPAWSADGSQLACVTLDGADIYATIHTLRGGSSRRVALPGRPVSRRLFMAWSPDQRFMAYIDTPPGLTSDATQLWVLRLGDGKAFPVTEGRSRTWSPSWSPQSDAIYFVSNLEGAMDLWQQALAADGVPDGPPVRVTTGIGMRAASLSPDGSKVVYSQGRKIANVWRVPIPASGQGTWADAHQVTFDQAYVEFLSVAPDGKRLIVTSDRSGNPDLWQLSVDGGELQPIVADPAPDWDGTWSPDGRYIAFFSYRSGNRDLWRVAVNGGPAEQLTDHPGPRPVAQLVAGRTDNRVYVQSGRQGRHLAAADWRRATATSADISSDARTAVVAGRTVVGGALRRR